MSNLQERKNTSGHVTTADGKISKQGYAGQPMRERLVELHQDGLVDLRKTYAEVKASLGFEFGETTLSVARKRLGIKLKATPLRYRQSAGQELNNNLLKAWR